MTADPVQRMDRSRLRSATPDELRIVDHGIAQFSSWFNIPSITPHQFVGRPEDIGKLDWVFYELGGDQWYRDNGFAFTCVWGNVLVRSFGFEWAVIGEPRDFRDYLLHSPETYILFPWSRLWELVGNPGVQFEKAENTWLRIVTDVEYASGRPLPIGWHPAIDAIRGNRTDIPATVTQLLEELSLCSTLFLSALGMWPYEWTADTDWALVERTLRIHLNQARHES